MDKYTYGIKSDKIRKQIRQEDYEAVVKIADTIEWKEVRDAHMLTKVAMAYEKVGRYDRAIDLMLLAYAQVPSASRYLYRVADLYIKAGNAREAEAHYKMYREDMPDDNMCNLLNYRILTLEKAPLEDRIEALEAFINDELDEEWGYRLAELYRENGEIEKCARLCSQVILYFGEGEYVDKALDLKERVVGLTPEQQLHRDNKQVFIDRLNRVITGEDPDEIPEAEAVTDAADVAAAGNGTDEEDVAAAGYGTDEEDVAAAGYVTDAEDGIAPEYVADSEDGIGIAPEYGTDEEDVAAAGYGTDAEDGFAGGEGTAAEESWITGKDGFAEEDSAIEEGRVAEEDGLIGEDGEYVTAAGSKGKAQDVYGRGAEESLKVAAHGRGTEDEGIGSNEIGDDGIRSYSPVDDGIGDYEKRPRSKKGEDTLSRLVSFFFDDPETASKKEKDRIKEKADAAESLEKSIEKPVSDEKAAADVDETAEAEAVKNVTKDDAEYGDVKDAAAKDVAEAEAAKDAAAKEATEAEAVTGATAEDAAETEAVTNAASDTAEDDAIEYASASDTTVDDAVTAAAKDAAEAEAAKDAAAKDAVEAEAVTDAAEAEAAKAGLTVDEETADAASESSDIEKSSEQFLSQVLPASRKTVEPVVLSQMELPGKKSKKAHGDRKSGKVSSADETGGAAGVEWKGREGFAEDFTEEAQTAAGDRHTKEAGVMDSAYDDGSARMVTEVDPETLSPAAKEAMAARIEEEKQKKTSASRTFEAVLDRHREIGLRKEGHQDMKVLFISANPSDDGVSMAVTALREFYARKGEKTPVASRIDAVKLNRKGLLASMPRLEGRNLVVEHGGALDDELLKEIAQVSNYDDTGKRFALIDTPSAIIKLRKRYEAVEEELLFERQQLEEDREDADFADIDIPDAQEMPADASWYKKEQPVAHDTGDIKVAEADSTAGASDDDRTDATAEYAGGREGTKAASRPAGEADDAADVFDDDRADATAEYVGGSPDNEEAQEHFAETELALEAEHFTETEHALEAEHFTEAGHPAEVEQVPEADHTDTEEAGHAGPVPADGTEEEDGLPQPSKVKKTPLIMVPEFKKDWISPVRPQDMKEQEGGEELQEEDEELEFDSDQILSEELFFKYVMQYAKRIDCFVEPSAEEAIRQEIEAMVDNGDLLTVEEAEMMVEDAADMAEKVSIASMFSSRYTKEGLLILKGRHFRR